MDGHSTQHIQHTAICLSAISVSVEKTGLLAACPLEFEALCLVLARIDVRVHRQARIELYSLRCRLSTLSHSRYPCFKIELPNRNCQLCRRRLGLIVLSPDGQAYDELRARPQGVLRDSKLRDFREQTRRDARS